MRRGLVAGKFMPLHKGHVALLRFAAAHCDELVIALIANEDDPIPADQRKGWLQEEFIRYVKIKVIEVDVPGQGSQAWATAISNQHGHFGVVFGSGSRDETIAEIMGAAYVSFDPGKHEYPVSGREILLNPFRSWDFIALPARGHFVKRICFYGPESTGKSTMAKRMADRYQTEFVPEVAREFISSNQFTEDDILRIAHAQTECVLRKTSTADKVLFCDTDLITTAIYSDVYLKKIPDLLKSLEAHVRYDQYFLFDIDVPWVADGLRDLGDMRQEMFFRFKGELDKRSLPYILLSGTHAKREQRVVQYVDDLLSNG